MSRSIERQGVPNNSTALARIQNSAGNLKRRQNEAQEAVGGRSLGERILGALGALVPATIAELLPEEIKGRIAETPAARMRADLRGAAHDTHEYCNELLKQGNKRVDYHEDLKGLLSQVRENPEDRDLLMQLRDKLRAPAEEDLNLPIDEEAEEIFTKVLERATAAQKQTERDRIIEEAEQFLNISAPTIEALKGEMIAAILTRDSVVGEYGKHLEFGKAFDLLNNASRDVARAAELSITSQEVIIKNLEAALAGAKHAVIAVRIAKEQANQPIKLQELEGLQKEVSQLALNPAPKDLQAGQN